MDLKPVKLTLTCGKCGEGFEILSSTGHSNICDKCTFPVVEFIFGRGTLPPDHWAVVQ